MLFPLIAVLLAGAGPVENNLGCLVELELPRFATANRVPSGGTVTATVTVGRGGTVAEIEYTGSDERSLQLELGYHLTKRATYDPACSGKRIQLTFKFLVEGEPALNPFTIVRFRPPNQFVISTQKALMPLPTGGPEAKRSSDPATTTPQRR